MTTTLISLPTPTEWDLQHLQTCDASVRKRRLMELAVVRKLATDLIAAGLTITVDDGDDEPVKRSADVPAIMEATFAVDECTLYIHNAADTTRMKPFAWIRIIYGNDGYDAISDYTTNLEEHLKGVNDYAEALAEWA